MANNVSGMGFGTRAVHAGNFVDPTFGAHAVPIYQTSGFVFPSAEDGGRRFAGEGAGYIYSRLGNPTVRALEEKLASLEGAEDAAAAASGMGATSSLLWSLCKVGSHIIADKILYGCTFSFLAHGMTRYGVTVDFLDLSDLDSLKQNLLPETAVVYLETPANPNLKITDIKALCDITHAYNPNITVIADNTFATPYSKAS